MGAAPVQVLIRDEVFRIAQQIASQDNISVSTLLEDFVIRRSEFMSAMRGEPENLPAFSLADYNIKRDPDESDEDYEFRVSVFR